MATESQSGPKDGEKNEKKGAPEAEGEAEKEEEKPERRYDPEREDAALTLEEYLAEHKKEGKTPDELKAIWIELELEEEPIPPKILPPGCESLVKVLARRLENQWLGTEMKEEERYCKTIYDTEIHLKRRPPKEIEAVLATMDSGSLEIINQVFGTRAPNMHQFAEAIVRTGTYDADGVLEFMGGVVDLFHEVLWSQASRAKDADDVRSVRWGQLMNHFIESPEIAMFEGTEITASLGSKARTSSGETMPQMQEKRDCVDSQKHWGTYIEKLYWVQSLDSLLTIEGTESVYFWSPHPGASGEKGLDPPRIITPTLPADCFDDEGYPLYTVLGAAWDGDLDLTVLLSNRMLIVWRLRSREKFQFRQRAEYRIHAMRNTDPRSSDRDSAWKIYLIADIGDTSKPMGGHNLNNNTTQPQKRNVGTPPQGRKSSPLMSMDAEETQMRREKREDRKAAEYAHQLDIWWMASQRYYVTTDRTGKLCFWNIGIIEGTGDIGPFYPAKELTMHTDRVTAFMELGMRKFVTASLDRTFVVWDSVNIVAENKIEEHTASVLSVAYLQQFYSLVSVGCEKRVYVWSIDSTAYRGLTAKLSGHQANLLQVAAGNDNRGRIFITLDEASAVILWDVATLQQIQSFSANTFAPRHALCISTYGRFCLAGRRFYFYEANELLASYMGATPTKEQIARAKSKPSVQGSFKERAAPLYCVLNPRRGSILSVTQAEVRLHCRGNPAQSRAVFCLQEGEVITSFAVMDSFHMTVLGTSKGSIYFLKYRSGFTVKVYEGRPEGEAWEPIGGGGAPPEAEAVEAKQRTAAGSPVRGGAGVPPGARDSVVTASGAAESGPGAATAASASGAAAAGAGYSKLGRPPGTASREAHGSRSSEALGADGQAGEAGQASMCSEELERAVEREQELKEVQQIVDLGFAEADAQRAIQQVPRGVRAAAAKRYAEELLRNQEVPQEAPQEPPQEAPRAKERKTLLPQPKEEKVLDTKSLSKPSEEAEDALAEARANNVEQAVEKLLTGAIATVGGEEAPPVRLAARAEMREGEEPQVRVKSLKRSGNGPSPEDIAKGMSRKIQCILPCEEQNRIFVGTVEGQVLVVRCDANFTVIRWITQPGPNMVAVTCLDCCYQGDEGLLLVGTQDNCGHLYGLPNYRLAGSINMGTVLPEPAHNAGELISVRHARLLAMPPSLSTSHQFPLAVVTVDKRSRIRLWGLRLHGQSGKLEELALLLDGGQLLESQGNTLLSRAGRHDTKDEEEKVKKEVKKEQKEAKAPGKAGKAVETKAKAKAGKDAKDKKDPKKSSDPAPPPTVNITCMASIEGPVVVEETYLKTLPQALVPEKPVVAAPTAVQSAAWAALAAAFAGPADGAGKDEASAGEKDKDDDAAQRRGSVHFGEEDSEKEGESSDDEDDKEVWEERHLKRTNTPDWGYEGFIEMEGFPDQPVPRPPDVIDMDGSHFLFLCDSAGRVWIFDVVATVLTAVEEQSPYTVLLDENATKTSLKGRRRRSLARSSKGAAASASAGSMAGNSTEASPGTATQPLLSRQGVPIANPEGLRLVTSWQAHDCRIQSIMTTTSPPGLVTTDDYRGVKVWSTIGELWADFTLYGLDAPLVFTWPPPHVLGAQHALMNIAKRLCHRMGLPTSRDAEKQAQKDLARKSKFIRRLTEKGAAALTASAAKADGTKKKGKAQKGDDEADATAGPSVLMTELPEPAPATPPAAQPTPPATASSSGAAGAAADGESLEPETSAAGSPSGAVATEAKPVEAEDEEVDLDAPVEEEVDLDAPAEEVDLDGPAEEEEAAGEEEAAAVEVAEDDQSIDLDALGSEEGEDSARQKRKAFTTSQLRDMIRNHGFSSGFQSYKQFHERGKNKPPQKETSAKRRLGQSLTRLEVQRHSFFGRQPDDFGVKLRRDQDKENWKGITQGMGRRSESEGALLRFSQSAVDEMTRAVRDDLGVDVSKVSLRQMRKASFIERLDVNKVSYDPKNSSSATAQAVKKVLHPEGPRRMTTLFSPRKSAMGGAGSMIVGRGKR